MKKSRLGKASHYVIFFSSLDFLYVVAICPACVSPDFRRGLQVGSTPVRGEEFLSRRA